MSKHLVFVYGSLRQGSAGSMSIRFPDTQFVTNAQVRGSLYDLGAYPGLLLHESDSLVNGELYEVDDETLARLDQFELTSDYLRKRVEVNTGSYRRTAWIYVPDFGPDAFAGRTLIRSGDWIEYSRMK